MTLWCSKIGCTLDHLAASKPFIAESLRLFVHFVLWVSRELPSERRSSPLIPMYRSDGTGVVSRAENVTSDNAMSFRTVLQSDISPTLWAYNYTQEYTGSL